MRKNDKAPTIPGKGSARSLVKISETMAACPCCGAVWKGSQPWTEKTMTPAQLSKKTGMSPQNITDRIRRGTIAAYPVDGLRTKYLIPISEAGRVMAENQERKTEEVGHG